MPATKEQTDEHPIIFSGWSIRRIFADEKSQTRRIVKPQPPSDVRSVMWDDMGGDWIGTVGSRNDPVRWNEKCPYGQPGDVLWGREAFRVPEAYDDMSPREYVDESAFDDGFHPVQYEADESDTIKWVSPRGRTVEWGRKRPSIHMPRELCRLRLRVEDIRVERVQEVDYQDMMAEGIEPETTPGVQAARSGRLTAGTPSSFIPKKGLQGRFVDLWNDIHGDGAWEENPFVWCVEFSKIDTE